MYYRKRSFRKRGGYRRRRRYTGGMRTNSRGGAATSQLAVYRNAFSTATTNPKIPDGKAYSSAGIRLQAVKEFSCSTAGPMDFLLFPGLNNGLIMARGVQSAGRYAPYASHGQFQGTPGTAIQQGDAGRIDKWRLVSQALKLTLINNSDENDGWFEAARVQISSNAGIGITVAGSEPGSPLVVGTYAVTTDLPGVDVTRQMVENPSYVTGKLRDIHKHVFQLMAQGNDHDFHELSGAYVEDDQSTAARDFIDRSFDAIHIRINGRGGTTPTRLMAHVVSNQEIVYDEEAPLVRFHSETALALVTPDRKRRGGYGNSPKASTRMKTS